MPLACIPTLVSGDTSVAVSESSVISSLIYFFFTNPGDISDEFPNLLSFRKQEATHETDPEGLINSVRERLSEAIRNHFPNRVLHVIVDRKQHDVNYTMVISVIDAEGKAVVKNTAFVVDGDKVRLSSNIT